MQVTCLCSLIKSQKWSAPGTESLGKWNPSALRLQRQCCSVTGLSLELRVWPSPCICCPLSLRLAVRFELPRMVDAVVQDVMAFDFISKAQTPVTSSHLHRAPRVSALCSLGIFFVVGIILRFEQSDSFQELSQMGFHLRLISSWLLSVTSEALLITWFQVPFTSWLMICTRQTGFQEKV